MLTLIIPACSTRDTLCDMTVQNARAWRDQCDEMIISEDGGYCAGLAGIADFYILHKNIGVCLSLNVAWELAITRGAEYVVLLDSDVSPVEGSLRQMCIPGKVSVPTIVQHPDTAFVAPMLCVPRSVSDKYGMYDYRDGNNRDVSFDADFHVRVQEIVVKVREVKVSHIGGATRFGRV